MDALLNPEVIAGVILAFYFFARGAVTLRSKNGNGNGSALKAIREEEYKKGVDDRLDTINRNVDNICKLVNDWDKKIDKGDFTCKWNIREVVEVNNRLKNVESKLNSLGQ